MIKHEKRMIEEQVPVSITCDVCKKEFDLKKDIMEVQEFQHIRFTGGFDSVFGDGATVRLDICQHCLKKTLGQYFDYEDIHEEVVE